nr:NAD(P)/FAD-dependent oxidoreductase [uncultured Oscillibacter sp.]
MEMHYQKLFEKGYIGGVEIRNRVAMTAMGNGLASWDGEASPELIRFYEDRARGGCGLIFTEFTRVDETSGACNPNQLCIATRKHVRSVQRMAERVHRHGARIFVQLHHGGREAPPALNDGKQPMGPSAILNKVNGLVSTEMTKEEIGYIIKKFVAAAVNCQKAGIDGVELHAAHGYLLGSFISPYTNKRTDEYGGSAQNRCRIVTEIINGIRTACGRYPICVRINGSDFVEGGITLDYAVEVAKTLEAAGADALNISCAVYETVPNMIEPNYYEEGWRKELAKTVKAHVKIPVIAVNTIKFPATAEKLLEEGVSDFVGVSRGQMADPEWVNKARAGREDLIRKCMGCMQCNKSVVQDGYLSCAANPVTGRGTMYNDEYLIRSGAGRNVVVIGGGPAGMQAAITLAKRAFHVILLEQKSYLGGMAYLATVPPHKTMVAEFIKTLEAEMKELGVDVRMNVTADVATVKALEPYAVVVANGGTEIVPQVAGLDSAHVHTMEDTLLGKVKFSGRKVAVIGGGMVGLETAHYLCKDNQVTIVEMTATPGATMYPTVRNKLLSILKEDGVELLLNHALTAVEKDGLLMICTDSEEPKQERMAVDEVVIAVGRKPNMDLYHEMGAAFERVVQAGDCIVGGSILEATRTGNDNVWFL